MELQGQYYLKVIKEDLSQKQKNNPHYSLRAYARDLDVHPSTLSQIIKGARPLPLKDSKKVIQKLGLSPKEQTLFLESLFQTKTKLDNIKISQNDERFMLDESYHRVIAEWEHYAVLELFELKKFNPSVKEIAAKLQITENRAEVVLENLRTSGLVIEGPQNKLIKTNPSIRTTEDIKSQALQKSHQETLELGIKKLDEIEVDLRDFSSMMIAVDLEKLTEAKTVIREFRQKMATLLRDGDKTDIYQLAIQFYPLTEVKKSKQES